MPKLQALTIILDFNDAGQGTTTDIWNNSVSEWDPTDFAGGGVGHTETDRAIIQAFVLATVRSHYYDIVTTNINADSPIAAGQQLNINFEIGNHGTLPSNGDADYFVFQIGTHTTGTSGLYGTSDYEQIRNNSGASTNLGTYYGISSGPGDIVGSIFTNSIANGLINSYSTTFNGNLIETMNMTGNTISHEIGHALSMLHVYDEAGTVSPNGLLPLMASGSYGISGEEWVAFQEFSTSARNTDENTQNDLDELNGAVGTRAIAATSGLQFWNGGNGVWDGASTNWSDRTLTMPSAWTGNIGIFYGTGATLSLGSNQNFEALLFSGTAGSAIYTINGNGFALNSPGLGALIVEDDDIAVINAVISGGNIIKSGGGTLIFEGDNTYTGSTIVTRGTLLINGDQSAAQGNVFVESTGALGGSGIIGGDVEIANLGVLFAGNSPGTLTMRSLTLNDFSVVRFELGAVNSPGHILNDAINVNGNLILDGFLEVTEPVGGNFLGGYYRLFNYTGTLTNNQLGIVSAPVDVSDLYIQYSVPGQINLVNETGLVLNFWDGNDPSKYNDGIVQGGSGTWILDPPNDNWTDVNGTANVPFKNLGYAIFTNTGGTVTIDNSNGVIYPTGMQFGVNGYTIQGAPITTFGPEMEIRVGDGTILGYDMLATINSVITGGADLRKTDFGTLLLNASNTYAGDTFIDGGALYANNVNALSSGQVTLGAAVLRPLSELNISGLTWNDGRLYLRTGQVMLDIAGDFMNGGTGGAFLIDHDNSVPLQEVYTLLTYGGPTNFTSADFSGDPGVSIPNVTTQHTFELTPDAVLLRFTAQAEGPILQNSAPVFIPTFADFFVRGQVRTGETNESNTIKSLSFDPGSRLQVYNNLTVTSGNFTVNSGRAIIAGGTVLVPNSFHKFGAGLLDAQSNFIVAGQSFIHGGALAVNGTFQTPVLHVLRGGTLMGNGVVIGNVINAGTVAPGNSIGLLTILGNYHQTRTGALEIEAASVSNHDVLVVSGHASLSGELQLKSLGYRPRYGDQIPFLRAGRITGGFDRIVIPEPEINRGRFLNLDTVGVLLVAPSSYTLVAKTPNDLRLARALDRWIGIEEGDIGTVTLALDLLREEEYAQAFSAISPSFYEGAVNTSIELSQSHSQIIHQQLSARRLGARIPSSARAVSSEAANSITSSTKSGKTAQIVAPEVESLPDELRWNVWTQGSGMFSSGGLSLTPGESFESGTILVGADYALSQHFAVGLFASYQEGWGDYDNGGNTDLESVRFGGYAMFDFGGFYANAVVGGGQTSFDIKRPIQWATLNRMARSNPDGSEFFTSLGTGYDLQRGNWTFGPQLTVQYSKLKLDTFTERGADSLNLRLNGAEADSLRSYLGGRLAYTHRVSERFAIIPEVRAFWQHEFLDGDSFRSHLAGGRGPGFDYQMADADKDSLYLGAGLGFQMGTRFYANIYYNADIGRNDDANHTVSVSATWRF